jgi:hypothetical protein
MRRCAEPAVTVLGPTQRGVLPLGEPIVAGHGGVGRASGGEILIDDGTSRKPDARRRHLTPRAADAAEGRLLPRLSRTSSAP